MVHGSLFSGIGGFDLAAEWMGWENAFHCEIGEFGRRVLNYYWPNAISYDDITKTDFTIWRDRIDIITGGFPCQPYSTAGKRLGKEDDRHLWPEMLRAIRDIRPRYVVGENVYGLLSWNDGMVFEEVQADLENEGYKVRAIILPASGVNAPHKRYRIWFVANTDSQHSTLPVQQRRQNQTKNINACGDVSVISTPNTVVGGLEKRHEKQIQESRQNETDKRLCGNGKWENFPIKHPICSGNDGLSDRLDGITFSKWRRESIKAYGNAIVPQVAYQIFKAIEETERKLTSK